MIDPHPIFDCPRILPEIVKFRLSLHKVKDDGSPTPYQLVPGVYQKF